MRPHLRARMPGTTAWVQRNTDFRFTAMVRSKSSSRELVDAADQADAGVVHQHVDRSELALDRRHHPGHLGRLRHVGADRHRPTAGAVDRFDDIPRLGCFLAIIHGNGGSGFGQRNGDGLADAARSSRHQRNPVVQGRHCSRSVSNRPRRHVSPFCRPEITGVFP